MATVASPPFLSPPSQPRRIPQATEILVPPQAPSSSAGVRSGHLNLDTFSPVNQNGSFEFDRVLKTGDLRLRTRKTKAWKPVHVILRPNLISIYKGKDESQLRHLITLSDLTAVALSKDPKYKGKHVFGLYSPSRNYRLEASTAKSAYEWVDLIRREARIEEEEDKVLGSLAASRPPNDAFHRLNLNAEQRIAQEEARLNSSSPEPIGAASYNSRRGEMRVPDIRRQSLQNLDYSANELASNSDFSDNLGARTGISGASSLSIPRPDALRTNDTNTVTHTSNTRQQSTRASGIYPSEGLYPSDERVVWHGFLSCLRSKGGVRQWKKLWVVLRPKNLTFYKNEEEYAARLLIPLSSIVSAVEIDPITRSKRYCMQIITEEKTYRFCAPDEEALDKWLGALKSQIARKKESNRRKLAGGAGP